MPVRGPGSAVRGSRGHLEKARKTGAATARIVDVRDELCRDFAFPVLAWRAKYESIYLLGTSIARPLITKKCLQVAREVGADGVRPRRDRQGQRPVPLPAGRRCPGTRHSSHRPLADGGVPPAVSRPHGDDRLLPAEEHPGQSVGRQAVQLGRELPAHQLRGGQAGRPDGQRRRHGRVRHDRLAAAGPGSRWSRSRSVSRRACR